MYSLQQCTDVLLGCHEDEIYCKSFVTMDPGEKVSFGCGDNKQNRNTFAAKHGAFKRPRAQARGTHVHGQRSHEGVVVEPDGRA